MPTVRTTLPEDLLFEVEVAAQTALGKPCSAIIVIVPSDGTSDQLEVHTRMPLNICDLVLADLLATRLRDRCTDQNGNWIEEA